MNKRKHIQSIINTNQPFPLTTNGLFIVEKPNTITGRDLERAQSIENKASTVNSNIDTSAASITVYSIEFDF